MVLKCLCKRIAMVLLFAVINANSTDIGNQSVYTGTNTSTKRMACQIFVPEDCKITSISMYHNAVSSSYYTQFGVYTNSSSNLPGNKLAATAKTKLTTAAGWQTINLVTPINVKEGSLVWIAWMYQSTYGARRTGAVSNSKGYVTGVGTWSTTADNMPTAFGSASVTSGYNFSVYLSYIPDYPFISGVKPYVIQDSIDLQSSHSLCDVKSEYCSVLLPDMVDLRNWYKFNVHIKSQGQCSSCVSNAIVSAIEYVTAKTLLEENAFKYSNPLINLSVTQILGCGGFSCDRQNVYNVLKRLKNEEMPFVDSLANNVRQDPELDFDCVKNTDAYITLSDFSHCHKMVGPIITHTPDPEKIKKALANGFPVVANMVYDNKWNYDDDIASTTGEVNHAILIIGYIQDKYWIVQNCRGKHRHGGDGVFKLSSNSILSSAFAINEVSIQESYKRFSQRYKAFADVNSVLLGE